MATWKKILVEGDAVASNLATADLTQANSSRVYTLNGDTNRLSFKGGITQMVDTTNDQEFSFDTVNRVFDVHNGNSIRFREDDDTNFVALKADTTVSADYTITLPGSAPGGANKILESDASGNLSWIDTPSGGGGVTINNNTDNYLITASGTANTLNGESGLTYGSSILSVTGRIYSSDFISLTTNNKSLYGFTTGSSLRNIAKVNNSDSVEIGDNNSKLELKGSSIDADALQFSCGPATMDEIVATNISLSSTGDHGEGSVVTYFDTSSSYSTTVGRVYYHNGATTGNKWSAATSSAEAGNKALVGIALGTDQSAGFLLRGFVNPGVTMTVASQCFLAANSSITNTVPTSGFSRVMGHSVTTTVMYFNPSADYIDL